MLRLSSLLALAAAFLPLSTTSHAAEVNVDKIGKKITLPALNDLDGKPFAPPRVADAKAAVVVFLSFDCPVSNSYAPELNRLAEEYGKRDVAFLGVCCAGESRDKLARQAAEFRLAFPVLHDPERVAAGALKAVATPEAFVLDRNGVLRYRGRVDDAYYARLKKNARGVSRRDLEAALDEVLAGKPVSVPATEPIGCPLFLGERAAGEVTTPYTFHRDVLPVLRKNCQGCHRPGAVGPFSLMTYKHALNWAEDIKHYTRTKQMPPWKPVAGPEFLNNRSMSQEEIDLLASWVNGGTPEGDPEDAPPAPEFAEGWQLGEPDLVLTVPEDFHLGASGNDLFRCFVLPTGLEEDRHVVAFEVRPGNPRVVHHTLNFFDLTGSGRKLEEAAREKEKPGDEDRGPGYSAAMGVGFIPPFRQRDDGKPAFGGIGGWAPGQVPHVLPEGTGFFLPKGADIILQVHYHRNGRPETDRTRIGLYFAKGPVDKPWKTLVIPGRFLYVPANDPAFEAKGSLWVEQDCTVHSVMPHMHLLGKSVKVTMTPPGGEARALVEIADWDYNWQETYWFKEPIDVKAGTRFDIVAVYDNSDKNPNNPNHPPRPVLVGEQTTNEMLFGFLGATSDTPGRIRTTRREPAAAPGG